MLLLPLLALQIAAGAPASDAASEGDPSIVINGISLQSTRAALDRCIAAHCPPDREIDAALRYANQQFLAGDYVAARSTVLQSRRRNNRFASTFPEPVSDLARAATKLSMMVGRVGAAHSASLDAVGLLKKGLPGDSPTIMVQRLELGDQYAREGRLEMASAMYDRVAAQGRAAGNIAVEGHALYRSAVLFSAVASVDSDYRYRARRAIARIAERTEPGFAPFRDGLTLLAERLKVLEAKPSQRQALLDRAPRTPLQEPVLLSEPWVDLERPGLSATQSGGMQSEWADVSFWVKPDGSVADVHVEQTSAYAPGAWLPVKLKAVAARRYAPFAGADDAPPLYRVERYSMVYDLASPTGSRIMVRNTIGRIDTTTMSSTYKGKDVPVQ